MDAFIPVCFPELVQTCKQILGQCLFCLERLFDLIVLDVELIFAKLRGLTLGLPTAEEYRCRVKNYPLEKSCSRPEFPLN